jgi:hypothetical protein
MDEGAEVFLVSAIAAQREVVWERVCVKGNGGGVELVHPAQRTSAMRGWAIAQIGGPAGLSFPIRRDMSA